jgi:hypothetical protein
MIIFLKAHPVTQAMSARPITQAELLDAAARGYRSPGEPSAEQAEAGTYNKPRVQWQGLTIAIENPAGSVRRGTNRHGVSWEIRMRFDYGEVLGSMGVDGDPVDVYLGPNLEAPMVYVVHQRRVNDWVAYDEDKCMIGFDCQSDAEAAFLSNYNDPRFLGPITAMPVDEFVAKVRATKDKPAMIKAAAPVVLFFKAQVGAYLRGGKMVNLNGYQGRAARAVASAGQMSLFASDDVVTTPRAEMIAEHERLVDVLNSPSREDDKAEAKKQAAELAEYKDAEPDHLLADIPGAKWRRGKGLIAGRYGVEVDGRVDGGFHVKPEDAVADAKNWIETRKRWADESANHEKAMGDMRERLLSGGEVTDADLKLLDLKAGSSGLKWFIPAAAKVFGITSHAVRPHIKDMIRIGHTDMGAKLEFVSPRKALKAVAAGLAPKPATPVPPQPQKPVVFLSNPTAPAATSDEQIARQAVQKADELGLKGKDRKEWVADALATAWGMTKDEAIEAPEAVAALKRRPTKASKTKASERFVEGVMRQGMRAIAQRS